MPKKERPRAAPDYVRDWRLRDLVERLDCLIDGLEDDLGEDDLDALKAATTLLHELRNS